METILSIEGMSCENCEKHVADGILEVEGVESVEVSLDEKKAVVQHDKSVTLEMLKEAVEDVGYDVV